jgi:polyhydroxybutyrate depolymerase
MAIDRRRVFSVGISNGGLMSYRLACERSAVFRGIAAVAASMPEALACEPSQPVSVLITNGTDDPLVLYERGEIALFRCRLGRVLATQATYAFWAGADGCQGVATVTAGPDIHPEDGTEVQRSESHTCEHGTRVELYTILGGGHTCSGGPQRLPVWLVGRVSHDLWPPR